MNKKERELLKYIEDNSEYSGDFNAINNRIVIDDSMLYKKKKRFPFLITISASLAGVILTVVLVLPSLLSGNNNVANPSIENMESILQSAPVMQHIVNYYYLTIVLTKSKKVMMQITLNKKSNQTLYLYLLIFLSKFFFGILYCK